MAPVVGGYLRELEDKLRRRGTARLRDRAERRRQRRRSGRRHPVNTVLSSPAAGVAGAFTVAKLAGFEQAITFDMGGTSTDVALCPGRILSRLDIDVGGLPLRVPAVDVHTVGAGGGSLARIDAGGALRVGPESAGANPGPASYGQGGGATVTDAQVVLGRLQPEHFLPAAWRLMPLVPVSRSIALAAQRSKLPQRSSRSPTQTWSAQSASYQSSVAMTRATPHWSHLAAQGRCTPGSGGISSDQR